MFAESYLEGKHIADRIRLACDNFTGEFDGVTIQEASLSDERDGEPVEFGGEGKPTYSVEMTFLIRFAE